MYALAEWIEKLRVHVPRKATELLEVCQQLDQALQQDQQETAQQPNQVNEPLPEPTAAAADQIPAFAETAATLPVPDTITEPLPEKTPQAPVVSTFVSDTAQQLFWKLARLAVQVTMPQKVQETGLDMLCDLVQRGQLLFGSAAVDHHESTEHRVVQVSATNDIGFLHSFCSTLAQDKGIVLTQTPLESLIGHVCLLANYKGSNDNVQIKLIRLLCLLASFESEAPSHTVHHQRVQGLAWLQAVMTLYNLTLFSAGPLIRNAARTSLLQVVNGLVGQVRGGSNPLLQASSPVKPQLDTATGSTTSSPDPTTKEEEPVTETAQFVDLFLTLHLLCQLVSSDVEHDNEFSDYNRSCILALELILSILLNTDVGFQQRSLLFVSVLRKEVTMLITRHGLSPNIRKFELCLSCFLATLGRFRALLKVEIGILFSEVYLRLLEMPSASFGQKDLILRGLVKIASQPQALVDIYVNYDCDLQMPSVFERIIHSLVKIAQVVPNTFKKGRKPLQLGLWVNTDVELEELWRLQLALKALKCLEAMVGTLWAWCEETPPPPPPPPPPGPVSSSTFTPKPPSPLDSFTSLSLKVDGGDSNSNGGRLSTEQPHPHALPALTKPLPKAPIMILNHPLQSITLNYDASHLSLDFENPESRPDTPVNHVLEHATSRKQLQRQGIQLFNLHPNNGKRFFVQHGFVQDTPHALATFFHHTPLSKRALGEFLGDGDAFNIQTMHAFIDMIDLSQSTFVTALRRLLQKFRLPGEAQKIDRFMEKFAAKYCEGNPGIFANADTAYVLAFSVIMLNTDLHSSQITNRMDKAAFIRNSQGIQPAVDLELESSITTPPTNDVALSNEFLGNIYDEIAQEEIVLNDEQPNSALLVDQQRKREVYLRESSELQMQLLHLLQRQRPTVQFFNVVHSGHVQPMFLLVCFPLLAIASQVFEYLVVKKDNLKQGYLVQECLKGCVNTLAVSLKLACFYRLHTVRAAFLAALVGMTSLGRLEALQPKHVLALYALLQVASVCGNGLENEWLPILETISRLDQLHLLGPEPGLQAGGGGGYLTTTTTTTTPTPVNHPLSDMDEKSNSSLSLKELAGPGKPLPLQDAFGDFSPSPQRRLAVPEEIWQELQSQHVLVAVDQVFSNSALLNPLGVVCFLQALCKISLQEVGLDVADLQQLKDVSKLEFKNKAGSAPRLFSLQKIVEVTYYNMQSRIRFEWAQIWSILLPYFSCIGTHPSSLVSSFAVDALRQLASKFLERDELAHFDSQSSFLLPLVHIMRHNRSFAVHELVVGSLEQLVQARSQQLRSGWKVVFTALKVCAQQRGNVPLMQHGQSLVKLILDHHSSEVAAFMSLDDALQCCSLFVLNAGGKGHQLILQQALTCLYDYAVLALFSSLELPLAPWWLALRVVLNEAERVEICQETASIVLKVLQKGVGELDPAPWQALFIQSLEVLFESLSSLTGEHPRFRILDAFYQHLLLQVMDTATLFLHAQQEKAASGSLAWLDAEVARLVQNIGTSVLLRVVDADNKPLCYKGLAGLARLVTDNAFLGFGAETWQAVTFLVQQLLSLTLPKQVFDYRIDLEYRPDAEQVAAFSKVLLKCELHLAVLQLVRDMALAEETPASRTTLYSKGLALAPVACQHAWLQAIAESHALARRFNAFMELRQYLKACGFVQRLPNLVQQESITFTLLTDLGLAIYVAREKASHDDVSGVPPSILETLRDVHLPVLVRIAGFWETQQVDSHRKELALWLPAVAAVFEALASVAWTGLEPAFKAVLVREYYPLAVALIACDDKAVRRALGQFFMRVKDTWLTLE